MRYTTLREFEAMFSQRDLIMLCDNKVEVDRVALLEEVNSQVVDRVHGYLRGRFNVPLNAPVDGLISGVTRDLMKVSLYRRRDELHLPESVWRLEKQAYDTLKDIQKGIVGITVLDDVGIAAAVANGVARVRTTAQKFVGNFTNYSGFARSSYYDSLGRATSSNDEDLTGTIQDLLNND